MKLSNCMNYLIRTKESRRLVSSLNSIKPLFNVPPTNTSMLSNGFRVVSEDWQTDTSTVGVWINTGSRYEDSSNNGVAHYLEHMAFKGTKKRTMQSLELEIESKGAKLNAYTAREMTAYYVKCLNQNIDWSIELLSDILRYSVYEEKAIIREKSVILREAQDIESNFQETIFDYMHKIAFPSSSLGYTILGPEELIKAINRKHLYDFVADQYKPHRMQVVGVGGIEHERLIEITDKYFGDMAPSNPISQPASIQVKEPAKYFGTLYKEYNEWMPQVHVVIAFPGPGHMSNDTVAIMVACSIIGMFNRDSSSLPGGPLAKKCFNNSTVHNYQCFFTCYHDVCLWGLYLVSEGSGLDRTMNDISEEMNRLCESVSDEDIERAKNNLKANLLTSLDGTTPVCEEIGRHMITYDRRVSPQEMVMRIDSITCEQVKQVCRESIKKQDLTVVALGPISNLPEYDVIRSQLH